MSHNDKVCPQCTMTREQRVAYPDGCPLVVPALGCPFYDAPRSAERRQEPDGWAVLFMPGTEHFCYVGIWTKKATAEDVQKRSRGGDSRVAPMYLAPQSAKPPTICYVPCKAHEGMAYTMTLSGWSTPAVTVCPICHPPEGAAE